MGGSFTSRGEDMRIVGMAVLLPGRGYEDIWLAGLVLPPWGEDGFDTGASE